MQREKEVFNVATLTLAEGRRFAEGDFLYGG